MNFGISTEIVNEINSIFVQYPNIERVDIFGSRAKGTYSAGSDIDLVIISQLIDHNVFLEILSKIDELELIYKIDLLQYSKITEPALKEHIDRVGQAFFVKK